MIGVVDEDGMLAIEVKPDRLLVAHAAIAHLGCRGSGPPMETWVGLTFGERWRGIPPYSPTKLVRVIKSLIAREVFRRVPAVKKYLWGGEFWSDGYYISTVGRHGSEGEIQRYIAGQGR
jgi:hypothetical protein